MWMPGGDALAVEVRAGGSLRCSWAGAVLLGCPRERRGGCWVARERSGPGERRKGSGLGRSGVRKWAGAGERGRGGMGRPGLRCWAGLGLVSSNPFSFSLFLFQTTPKSN